ncbi:MAG: hypothetical protein FIA99_15030 [Ruminiclostridium sp.]|nr:hypothetical protein [Ruminiclostridium sp.]
MLLNVPNNPDYIGLNEGDLIALTKDDKFIGYAKIFSITSRYIILDADKKIWKVFNELIGESIPFDFDIKI